MQRDLFLIIISILIYIVDQVKLCFWLLIKKSLRIILK